MKANLGIRTKIAGTATIATVALLSLVGAIGYRVMVDATRQSQVELLNDRLDELEGRLAAGEDRVSAQLQIDSSLRVIRVGTPVPTPIPGTLWIQRDNPDPEILALVGRIDTRRIDATFDTIRVGLWVSVLVTGAVVGVVVWVVVGRALAPVRRLTRQADTNLASQSLDLLPIGESQDELAELATTFNAMLSRLRNTDVERRRFVSDASHELRTPLMVLSADAEYALDHPGEPASTASVELARSVLSQSSRLTELVDDLLALASLDEEQPAPPSFITVGELIERADLASLTPGLSALTAELAVADISRSLVNIVANAHRHSTEKIGLTIDAGSDKVRFIVDDDGPGIPVEEREQIFKRFYRPDEGRARRDGGAGLGLAIARAEIGRAGGTIHVDDSPQGGARFVVTVPTDDDLPIPPTNGGG